MKKFIWSTIVSLLIMFGLTYAAIDTFDHLYPNINRFYMAAVMTSPMIVIKALTMKSVFKNKHTFYSTVALGVTLTVVFFLAIRIQFAVGDVAFLRSMIPHHSSAIVMCERSDIKDPEIIELCGEIVETQKREIELMQQMLERM